ncbi:MAG: hypothetical protein ACI8WB_001161 [Phenylobacterium sp.]|jgi:hypothetical protein
MKSYNILTFLLSVIKHHGYSGEKDLQNFINISRDELKKLVEQLVRLGSLDKKLVEYARLTGKNVQPILA